MLKLITIA